MTLYNLFPTGTTLPLEIALDGDSLTLGTEFWVDTAGCTVTKLRWWCPNNTDVGSHPDNEGRIGGVYSIDDEVTGAQTLRASASFGNATPGEWCEVALETPLALTPYVRYHASIFHPYGAYPATGAFFSTGDGGTSLVQGPIHRPNQATAWLGERQGTYNYYAGEISAPVSSFNATSYFSDVEISYTESSGVTLSPSGVASAEAFGTATATATLTASPGGVASAEAPGTPSASTTLTASPAGIAGDEALGTPAASTTLTASPSGIASAEALGTPAAASTLAMSPAGIASAESFGTPAATATLTASPAGIASAEAFGTAVAHAPILATATGIGTLEALGSPTAVATLTAQPGGIATAAALGTPTATLWPASVIATAVGIGSLLAFGYPGASGAVEPALARTYAGSIPRSRYSGASSNHRWDGSLD